MLTLIIDTCLEDCTVLLCEDDDIVCSVSEHLGVGHAEHIGPIATRVIAESGATPEEVGAVACAVGPGSFMGVRVGVSFAKGFAIARRLPTIAFTTFDAIAQSTDEKVNAVVIDARREQVYCQIMDHAEGPLLLSLGEAKDHLKHLSPDRLAGSGVPVLFGVEGAANRATAKGLAAAARAGRPSSLAPLYLRPPDAKRPGAA